VQRGLELQERAQTRETEIVDAVERRIGDQ